MATRKKHDYKRRDELCAKLSEAHRQFHRLHTRWSVLSERRGLVVREATETMTREDYGFVQGYAKALWDASWATLVWKLGHAYSNETEATHDWDYKQGVPTYGGHFHATGELATDWLPLNR